MKLTANKHKEHHTFSIVNCFKNFQIIHVQCNICIMWSILQWKNYTKQYTHMHIKRNRLSDVAHLFDIYVAGMWCTHIISICLCVSFCCCYPLFNLSSPLLPSTVVSFKPIVADISLRYMYPIPCNCSCLVVVVVGHALNNFLAHIQATGKKPLIRSSCARQHIHIFTPQQPLPWKKKWCPKWTSSVSHCCGIPVCPLPCGMPHKARSS